MKKLLLSMLAVFGTIGLVACSDSGVDETATGSVDEPAIEEQAAPEAEEPMVEEPQEGGEGTTTAN